MLNLSLLAAAEWKICFVKLIASIIDVIFSLVQRLSYYLWPTSLSSNEKYKMRRTIVSNSPGYPACMAFSSLEKIIMIPPKPEKVSS